MAYFFQLPLLQDLTIAQQSVLNEVRPVAISGGPGTGKSVVSLWRHMQRHALGRRSILLTYTTTLATYLAAAARTGSPDAADAVYKTWDWLYHHAGRCDEIIVDEAQDLPEETYRGLLRHAAAISYGADDQQSIYNERRSTEDELRALFPENIGFGLDENFRNTYQIMLFVQAAMPNKLIYPATMRRLERSRIGPKPRVVICRNGQQQQNVELIDIINRFRGENHNIAVLVPFKRYVNYYHNIIGSAGITCSRYQNEDVFLSRIENVHVTTLASCKGTEFDTVIMPDFEAFRRNMETMYVATENHYYVALTRSRRNLFLLTTGIAVLDIAQSTFEIDRT